MSYEYAIIEWHAGDTVFDLVDKLNGFGRHGWRIVGIHPADASVLLVFLERPLAAERTMLGET